MDQIRKTQQIIEHVEQNLKTDLNLDKICLDCSNYSLSNVNQILKKKINTTLNEYIKNRRFFLACEDLLFSDKSITEISLDYKYSSISSFSRAFKDKIGVSPEMYRNNNKNSFLYPKIDLIDEEEKKKQADKAFKTNKDNSELIHDLLLKLALLYNKKSIKYYDTKFTILLELDKTLQISTPLQELEITSILIISNYVKNETLDFDTYAFFENQENGASFLLLQDAPYFFVTRIFLNEFAKQETLDKDIIASYFTVNILEEPELRNSLLTINPRNYLYKKTVDLLKEVTDFIENNFIQEVNLERHEINMLFRYVEHDLDNNLGELRIGNLPKSITEKITKDLDECILPQVIFLLIMSSIKGIKSGFEFSSDLYEKLIWAYQMDDAFSALSESKLAEISSSIKNGLFAYSLHTVQLGIIHDEPLTKTEKKLDHILKQKVMIRLNKDLK